jgi:hypothetical protein
MIMTTMITEHNQETQTLTFHQALDMAEVLARNALVPELHERLSCAVALVTNGSVLETDTPGTWSVDSASTPGKTYRINGHGCSCEDAFYRAPQHRCKHVLAVLLARKTLKLMQEPPPQVVSETDTVNSVYTPAPVEPEPPAEPVHGIDPRFVVVIQGKPFVRFAGLLQLAHERGLVSLTSDWTFNDADLSLAHAVAIFSDGRRFEESGDATPANTNKKVAPHFRRCALTRASARALRLALGIEAVAVEELAEE